MCLSKVWISYLTVHLLNRNKLELVEVKGHLINYIFIGCVSFLSVILQTFLHFHYKISKIKFIHQVIDLATFIPKRIFLKKYYNFITF